MAAESVVQINPPERPQKQAPGGLFGPGPRFGLPYQRLIKLAGTKKGHFSEKTGYLLVQKTAYFGQKTRVFRGRPCGPPFPGPPETPKIGHFGHFWPFLPIFGVSGGSGGAGRRGYESRDEC